MHSVLKILSIPLIVVACSFLGYYTWIDALFSQETTPVKVALAFFLSGMGLPSLVGLLIALVLPGGEDK